MTPPPKIGAAWTPPGAAAPCRALLRGLEAAGLAEAAEGQNNRGRLAELLVGARTQLAAKVLFYGAQPPLLARLLEADLPALLLAALDALEFEERKAAAGLVEDILTAGLRHGTSARQQVCGYVRGQPQIADLLLRGCSNGELAFLCGQLLCACARDAAVAELLLEDGAPLRLVCTARAPCCFEVASTALATLQELLLGGAEASVAYLLEHFRKFFLVYNDLLQSEDYATKRQALSVLGRVLLSPGFGKVMSRYASSVRSLKIQMTLLLHPTAMIKVGAFHIFKIFVANPHQAPAVQEILFKNREGLARLLRSLREMCEEGDEDFREDLAKISADVLDLRRPKGRDSSGSAGAGAQQRPPKAADEASRCTPLRGRTLQARDLPQHCQPQGRGPGHIHQEWSDLFAASTAPWESESLALSEAVAFVGVH